MATPKAPFTGATQSRVGRFTAADNGTIFLDEIGELPLGPSGQTAAEFLQEKEVTPVGESKSHRGRRASGYAATNRDLEEMVEKGGSFREDLLYRLNVIPVELPPLRDRATDIPELARPTFVERADRSARP